MTDEELGDLLCATYDNKPPTWVHGSDDDVNTRHTPRVREHWRRVAAAVRHRLDPRRAVEGRWRVKAFEISEKRFYCPMPEAPCPKCGAPSKMRADYLSYPTANQVFTEEFVCRKCNPDPYEEAEPFERRVILRCSLEVVP